MYELELHKNFIKLFEKFDNDLKIKLFDFLDLLKNSNNINDIKNIKKLTGYKNFYRYRLGDYRIGFYLENSIIKVLLIKSRGDFYKVFPKNYS